MRSSQSILKEINPKYSLEELMLKLKLQYFCHLMWRANSLEKTKILAKTEGKRKRVPQRMRLLDSITSSMDMNLSKFWEVVEDGGVWRSTDCQVTESRVWLSSLTSVKLIQHQLHLLQIYSASLWLVFGFSWYCMWTHWSWEGWCCILTANWRLNPYTPKPTLATEGENAS